MSDLLRTARPVIYADLVRMLESEGLTDLVGEAARLRIVNGCGCGDVFCSSFYTGPRPRGAWTEEGQHETIASADADHIMAIDVVDGRIRYVEVLHPSSLDKPPDTTQDPGS